MMEIKKESAASRGGMPTRAQLAQINAMAKAQLEAEQVYVFSLRLCDDQVDRDFERFDREALSQLAGLFVGKSGIADHQWSAKEQMARIFQTEVVEEEGVCYLKAWAYMRRGGQGEEWIADIEAGIKKEVSIGCAMARKVCSICGGEYGSCGHEKGQVYDGNLCTAILKEAVDAYEFSFVAVPAQREAGVMKALGGGKATLKELADRFGAQGEFRELYVLAQLGKEYEAQMREDVTRLCLGLELDIGEKTLRSAVGKMDAGELKEFARALERRMTEKYPVQRQLGCPGEKEEWDTGFMI